MFQKLFMIAKLGQGPSNMMHMQVAMDSDLVSPSFLVTPGGQSPAFPCDKRRRSSASSIIDDASLDSDSDEESGIALMTLNPRTRSDSVQTASSSQSSENKGKDVEAEEKEELVQQPQLQTDLIPPPEEEPQEGAMAMPRSESLGKISRSSSAPLKERPRVVDSSSLSRSSSAPQGPTPGQVLSLREGIIMKRREEEQEGSVSSSSASLNNSAGDSEMPSPSSQNVSIDFPSLPSPEPLETDIRTEPQSPDQQSNSEQSESSSDQDTYQLSPSPDETISSPVDDNEHEHSEPDQELDENSLNGSEEDTSLTAESKGNLPVPHLGQTPGFQALQSLSDSLESTMKDNEPVKQTPHIKSQLIAQHKIQSAITQPEQPRKRISLPRRSSPVVSRKSRPEVSVRGHDKGDQDVSEILQKIRDASQASNASTGEGSPSSSLERGCKLGKITKRSSESFPRSPVKPDKSHYPVGLDLIETRDKKEKSYGSLGASPSFLGSRKKSMSLSDLLSIGRDLTSGRSKEKDNKRDELPSKPLEPLSPLSPSTDEEAASPNDRNENKKEEKKSRFSRLRRKSSRTEMKDGIASGPNIDPKRASRHFFKESLMLESS